MMRKVVMGAVFALLSCAAVVAAAKPNLVLITVDAARADRVGFFGAKGAGTPSLDRLASESIVFEHAYAQAPGCVVSHATILSGAYPQSTGLSEIGGALPASLPYLPEILKSQSYKTAAFVGSIDLDAQNGLAQGLDRGFQSYDAGFRPVIPGDARPPVSERKGAEVVARAIAWLDKNAPGPFFLWVHISDARNAGSGYGSAMSAADAAVGKLVAALLQKKLYGSTAVIVAGDHGQGLGAHGEGGHGVFLYEETIRVPLLIKLPEGTAAAKPGTRVAAKARLVDVAPTMLEIAAVPVPSQMLGQSLMRAAKAGSSADQPVYSRADLPQKGFGWSALESWRAGKYLYVRAPKAELYDLTADPGATRNLAQSSKATLDTLASQLESFDRRFSGEGSKATQLSSSEMQKLASLGYAGLEKSAPTASAVTGTDPKDKIAVANKVLEAAHSAGGDAAALAAVAGADGNMYLAEFALGTALARKGQYAEAAKHLHKAIELQPDSAWAHYEIGAALGKAADYKTSVVHLEIAAGRLAGFAPAHAALAEAYDKVGRGEDAKKERGKAGK